MEKTEKKSRKVPTPTFRTIPALGQRGAKVDTTDVFVRLREKWMEAGRTSGHLAELLQVPRSRVANWANRSSGSYHTQSIGRVPRSPMVPPWWALVRMAHELGLRIVVSGEGVTFSKEGDGQEVEAG